MPQIVGIILAAGVSSRFPGNKLLASFQGEVVLRRIVKAALDSGLARIIVVLGHQAPEMIKLLGDLRACERLEIVVNADFQKGQSSSIKKGLATMGQGFQAAMFLVADQPLLTGSIIDDLIAFFQAKRKNICLPMANNQRRNPVIFSSALFDDLMKLNADQGGRRVIDAYPDDVAALNFSDQRPFADIDTQDDFDLLEARS